MGYTPPSFSFGSSVASPQYADHDQILSQPQQPPARPDFLQEFLKQFFANQAQQQNQQAQLGQGKQQLQRESIFGRHLGMGGQPIDPTTGMEQGHDAQWAQFNRTPEQVQASERQHFGGASYSAGDRRIPTAQAMAATYRPPAQMPGNGGAWVQGPNPAWGALPGGYDMMMANRNKGQGPMFGTMFGSSMPAGVEGPMQLPPRNPYQR